MPKYVSGLAKLALTGERGSSNVKIPSIVPPPVIPPTRQGSFSRSFSLSFSGGGSR